MALNDVLNMIGAASGNINQHRTTVNQAFDTQREALDTQMAASQSKNAAQGIITMQAAQADMTAQNNSRAAATALGNNMDVNTQIVTEISNNMRTASLNASNQAKKISDYKNASGVVGNLLGGFYDMMWGQEEEDKLKAFTAEVDTNARILQNMNAITLGTTQAQNAIKQTHTTATMAALQERITAESQEELARLQAEAGKINIQEVNQLMNMDSAQVNLLMAAEQAKNAAEARAMQREQRAMMNKAKTDALEAEQDAVSYYNEGVAASGVTDAIPIKNYKDLAQLIKIGDKRAESFMKIGMRNRVTGVASVATDPLELMNFARTNPSSLNPAQRRIYESIEQVTAESMSNENIAAALGLPMATAVDRANNAKAIADAKKDKDFMTQLARTSLIGKFNPGNVITPGDKTNPYAIPDYEFYKEAKFLDENGFTREYVKPLAVSGSAESGNPISYEPSQLIDMGAKAVLQGMPMDEVVAGITTMTRFGIAANNSLNNYKWMGMQPQDQANMSVNWRGDVNRSWNGGSKPMTRVTDMSDPLDVTTTLNSVLASKRKFGDAAEAARIYNENILKQMVGQ